MNIIKHNIISSELWDQFDWTKKHILGKDEGQMDLDQILRNQEVIIFAWHT